MSNYLLANGVRKYGRGNEDPWADAFRRYIGCKHIMEDLDGLISECGLIETDNRLRIDCITQDDKGNNIWFPKRCHYYVAVYERKESLQIIPLTLDDRGRSRRIQHNFLCDITDLLSLSGQKEPAKFIYVANSDMPDFKWVAVPVDQTTGEILFHKKIYIADTQKSFLDFYRKAGLEEVYQKHLAQRASNVAEQDLKDSEKREADEQELKTAAWSIDGTPVWTK